MAERDNDGRHGSVLVLVAAPERRDLAPGTVDTVRTALADAGARVAEAAWLESGLACELPFDGLARQAATAAARRALGGAPLDLAALPAAGRRKAILVADMDSTIVTSETLDELAAYAGVRHAVAAITRRAMDGELDFAPALRERVRMLRGLPARCLQETLTHVALAPGARSLVQTMKAAGARTALVSSGFTAIVAPTAERCGFDLHVANRLIVEDGRLTGEVAEPVVGGEAKLETLLRLATECGLPPAAACAVGDGANDLPMLQAAGLGVGYRAKPSVKARLPVLVDHGDLTAPLYLQGYRGAEIRR